jgi:transcriptional regulator with XRE-family HTH domain
MANMNKLKQKRIDKNMTQAELAEASEVSLRMIQHYEQGFKNINYAQAITVCKIAKVLNCNVEDLMNEEKDIHSS